jgi:hypothetical protein
MARLPPPCYRPGMETSDLAATLVSMSALKTQSLANIAVLKQRFKMEKSVLDLLAPASSPNAPPPPGMGRRVDKMA